MNSPERQGTQNELQTMKSGYSYITNVWHDHTGGIKRKGGDLHKWKKGPKHGLL